MPRATTIRFSDEVYARLDQASARTGMPVNSIVVAACLEWLAMHVERTTTLPAPRWGTLRRAVGQVFSKGGTTVYPFDRLTSSAQKLLRLAQTEAEKRGHSYIGTEHLLLACLDDPQFHSGIALAHLGITRQVVEARIDSMLMGQTFERGDHFIPTERTKKVLEIAFQLGAASGAAHVGTHHILWALSKEGNGLAAQVLNHLGAPLPRIEAEVASLKDPES